MKQENNAVTNKKAGNGNGNSVINNHEYSKNKATNYISGDSASSSSAHQFSKNTSNS